MTDVLVRDPDVIRCTGAEALVRTVLAEGVEHVFGVVGGKLAPLLHAISQCPPLRFTGLRHESSGPMMAAAVSAGSGRMAMALGEMGPGGSNLAAAMGVACNNNLPLLAVTSNQHRAASYPHSGMFMDLDTRAVLAPLTRWNAVVHDPRRIPELARRAFREAFGGRPGPVHLDFPQDVLAATCEFAADEFEVTPQRYRATVGSRPAAELVAAAAAMLRSAAQPLIVAGGGVVAADAHLQLREIARLLQAPVVPTQMALGVVPSDSPSFIGHGGLIAGEPVKAAFGQADVILSVGCRHSSWLWNQNGPLARRDQPVVSINTDPAALGHPVLHAVAMLADARLALVDLIEALGPARRQRQDNDWLDRMRALRKRHQSHLAAMADESVPPDGPMHPAALARAIADALPSDALAVFDGGHTTFWSNDFTPVAEVRTRFHEPGMSQLGFGLPYALSLQLQHPGRPVVNITGDGSFGFTLVELDTARRARLPVLTVIHNNAAWGIIRSGQRRQLDFELGTSLEGCDYAAIARGFGCHGETVRRAADVGAAIARALASGLPAVLDCHTSFVPHPCMPSFGSMNQFGFDALTRTGLRAVHNPGKH